MHSSRHSRNISFAPIGKQGQKRLSSSTVAVLGLGAIGSVAASYLARSGVNLILIDRDTVEISNLPRQLLYTNFDASGAVPKADAAQRALLSADPDISITSFQEDFSSSNAAHLLEGADLVVDATDNLEARFLLNEFCVSNKLPWVFSAVTGDHGVSMTFVPGSACLACFLPYSSGSLPTCESEGVLAPVAGVAGSIAASEAIKYITGAGSPNSSLLNFSLLELSFTFSKVQKKPSCRTCSKLDQRPR